MPAPDRKASAFALQNNDYRYSAAGNHLAVGNRLVAGNHSAVDNRLAAGSRSVVDNHSVAGNRSAVDNHLAAGNRSVVGSRFRKDLDCNNCSRNSL